MSSATRVNINQDVANQSRSRSTSSARVRVEDHLDDTPPPTYAEVLKEKSSQKKERGEDDNIVSLAHPQRVYIDRVFTSDRRNSSRYTYSNTKIRYLM